MASLEGLTSVYARCGSNARVFFPLMLSTRERPTNTLVSHPAMKGSAVEHHELM